MLDYFPTQDLIASFEPSLSPEVFDRRREVMSLKEVPTKVFERLNGVEFKKSDLSIRPRMVYL